MPGLTSSLPPNLPQGWLRNPPKAYRQLDEGKVDPELVTVMREAFANRECPIYLAGPVGCGKSFTAALVYVRWTGSVTMYRYCDMMSDAMECDKTGEVYRTTDSGGAIEMTRNAWWQWIENIGLLIVDEIGTGTDHEWRKELLWKLLEIRKGQPMLLTGNILLNAIGQQFDTRIQSRLTAGTVIEVRGSDRRRDGAIGRVHRIELKEPQ